MYFCDRFENYFNEIKLTINWCAFPSFIYCIPGLHVLVSKLKKLLACYYEVREMRKRFFKYRGIVFTLQCFWKPKFAMGDSFSLKPSQIE